MIVRCEDFWRELSNYLEGEVDTTLRTTIDEHLRGCRHCTAVLDGTRNVIRLYGQEKIIELPPGFSERLHRNLNAGISGRRNFLGWIITAAAAAVAAAAFEAGRFSSAHPALRSEHAQAAAIVPEGLMVVVSTDGNMFHVPGCRYVHGRTVQIVEAKDAIQKGYTPCVRCLKELLRT